MMLRKALIGFVICGLCQAVARAGPIDVHVFGQVGPVTVDDTETLSDPRAFADMGVKYSLIPAPSVSGANWGWNFNSTIDLHVSVSDPNNLPTAEEQNYVEVTGTIGMLDSITMSGTGTKARLVLAPGATPADIPPYLADLLNHPARVRFSGLVTGYTTSFDGPSQAELQSSLVITPLVDPNAVVSTPEPSTLVIALTALASLPVARRWRSGRI
jgi:hypothetical protein